MTVLARVAALASGFAVFACSAVGVRDTPQPAYKVVVRLGPTLEVRSYGARIVAETTVTGEESDARYTGFQRLAGYIFGANHAASRIGAAGPVAQQAGVKIAMTAPVAQEGGGSGRWRIRFFMPPQYTMQTLPAPNNPEVALVTLPPETLAVLRYTGTISPQAVATRTGELVAALEGTAWRPAGAPIAWFYDPPWTLPGLRRNEVAIPVSPN